MTQLPSLERWALLPFLGFSYPNLLLVFLNLLLLGTCIICFSQVLDFLWVFFILFYFPVPYFGLACDHGNSFLCLEDKEREGYWIEVRTVFNVKTTTTTTTTTTGTGKIKHKRLPQVRAANWRNIKKALIRLEWKKQQATGLAGRIIYGRMGDERMNETSIYCKSKIILAGRTL